MTQKRPFSRILTPILLLAVFLATIAGSYVAITAYDSGLRQGTCSARGLDTSHTYSTEQTANAAIISAISVDMQMPPRAASIALATAYQESRLENIDYGDRDSVGLFQQRPSQGWGTVEQIMDPVYAATKFYEALQTVEGYESMEITVAAQKVQRSGFPDAYADHEVEGRLFASALTGHSGGELQCDLGKAGGPGHPESVKGLLEKDFSRLTSSGEITASLSPAGEGAPEGAGATALAITVKDPKQGWAVANWAVAMAADSHIVAVDFAGERWDRSIRPTDEKSQWVPGEHDSEATVIVYLSRGSAG